MTKITGSTGIDKVQNNVVSTGNLNFDVATQTELQKVEGKIPNMSVTNVLMNSSSSSIDGFSKTKNHAVVTYTGNGDTQEIATGISSVDFTQPNNGSGFYNKRVGSGFAVIADDAVDLIDSSNDTSDVSNWTAVNDANLSVNGGVLSVNADDSDYPYAIETIQLSAGSYFLSVEAAGTSPMMYANLEGTGSEGIIVNSSYINGTIGGVFTLTEDAGIDVYCSMYSPEDDATATFSNLSILPVAGNGSGSCVANTSKVRYKIQSADNSNGVIDGLRGIDKRIFTDTIAAENSNPDKVSEFTASGVTVVYDNDTSVNADAETYVLYQTLYTHIKWGMTSHNKFYVEAYNPVTKEGMIMYLGSGIAGHQISHSAGVELGYWVSKSLNDDRSWLASYREYGYLEANVDNKLLNPANKRYTVSETSIAVPQSGAENIADSVIMMYYKCKSETFTIGTYIGTGSAGNKIVTKDVNGKEVKLRDVVIKRIDDVGDWKVFDSARQGEGYSLNLAAAAEIDSAIISQFPYGYFEVSATSEQTNALNGQYLYMGYIDTNATTTPDDTYFNLPTDDTNLNIVNGTFITTNGIDGQGYVHSTEKFTGTIDFSGVSDGLKWVGRKSDGTWRFEDKKPMNGLYTKTSADDNRLVNIDGKSYDTIGGAIFEDSFTDDIDGWTANNDANLSLSNGQLSVNANDTDYPFASQDITLEIGAEYTVKASMGGVNPLLNISGYNLSESGYLRFVAQNETEALILKMNGTGDDDTAYFDNISVYKTQPTLGTLQEPTAFLKHPVMVASETPVDIDYNRSLADTVIGTMEADTIVVNDVEASDVKIIDRPILNARSTTNLTAPAIVNWDTTIDTHNALSNGLWLCAKDGTYIITVRFRFGHKSTTVGRTSTLVYLNGSSIKSMGGFSRDKAEDGAKYPVITTTTTLELKKGDIIHVNLILADSDNYLLHGNISDGGTALNITYIGGK